MGLDRDFSSGFEHGGDIYSLAEELKIQERKIIDFSASINPLGISKKVKAEIRRHLKYLHNYPDPEARRLRKYLARYHGIDPETILCGNGSTELIYLIVRALNPERVLIPAPTFSEYERACQASSGLRVMSYELKKENNFEIKPEEFIRSMDGCNMAFLCNPNNPTGLLLKKGSVVKIAEAAKRLECYLIVDEAFIDFSPEDSVIDEVKNNPYLIVLRSMTKFYALSGLRIGYSVFPEHLIEILKKNKEPWTVNSLAQRAAIVAIKDRVYKNDTYRFIGEEKKFLEKSLVKLGIKVIPSHANFYLLRMDNAREIYNRLKRKGILVRDCSNFGGLENSYLRVAIKSHGVNKILLKNLAEMLYEGG